MTKGPIFSALKTLKKANVKKMPPTGCFQPITEQDRNTEANFFLGEKVLTQFTTNVVLKTI